MAGRAPWLAARRGAASRALARALWTTAVGAFSSEERAWISRIEAYRRELASDQTLTPPSFGSHSQALPGWASAADRPLAVSDTSSSMSIPPLECRLLVRLIGELGPRSCVELGTGFGISTAYQAAALKLNGAGGLITLDAATEWARIARRGLSGLGLNGSVEMRVGPIDGTLAEVLDAIAPIDYALLDADHTERATLQHFEALLPHLADVAVVVLDDINWTAEMRRAWKAVRRHERVESGVGLGRLGVTVISGR